MRKTFKYIHCDFLFDRELFFETILLIFVKMGCIFQTINLQSFNKNRTFDYLLGLNYFNPKKILYYQ